MTTPGWWAMALCEAVNDQTPLAVAFGGEELVLFRNAAGQAFALEDRCPHRRVPLALGRVVESGLQCGYHGWTFDGASGGCTKIPNLHADERVPPRYAARAFAVREANGFVHVWLGEGTPHGELPSSDYLPIGREFTGSTIVNMSHDQYLAAMLDGPECLLGFAHVRLTDFFLGDLRSEQGRVVLEPGQFYIFASKENVVIPADEAAEMAPIRPELVTARLAEIRAAGVTVAGSLTPQRTQELYDTVAAAGVDLFVIRGTTVSAEHVSSVAEPLNLKKFIYDLDVPVIVGGAATYTAALHLMRTGAAGVLVGFGGGAASTTRATLGIHAPMATAVADVAGARRDYLDESGGRYVHVIADGGVGTSGDIVKALAMGADAVMLGVALARATDAPGQGFHWGPEAHHPKLPRGHRVKVDQVATLEAVLYGPAPIADGTANLIGALKKSMATTGYSDLKEFQRVDVVVAPYLAG